MKAVVAAFNQEKAIVGAFSVIVQLHRLIVCSTSRDAAMETLTSALYSFIIQALWILTLYALIGH